MWLKLGGVRLHVSFLFAAFLAFGLQGTARTELLPFLLSAVFHECAHALALRRCGVRELTLFLLPGGARLESGGMGSLPDGKLAAAALAGPVCNFAQAGVAALMNRYDPLPFLAAAVRVNLTLGAGNLLPLSFLDGGAALEALCWKYRKKAPPGQDITDLLLTAGLVFLSAGFLLSGRHAETLLAFTGYCLFYQLGRRARP